MLATRLSKCEVMWIAFQLFIVWITAWYSRAAVTVGILLHVLCLHFCHHALFDLNTLSSHSGISRFLSLITYNFMEVKKNCVWWRGGNFWERTGKPSKMWPCYDPSSFPSCISLRKLCPNHWKPAQTPAYFLAIVEAIKNSLHSYGEALALFES